MTHAEMYPSVRAVLAAVRAELERARNNPGGHYARAWGDYELVDGRTVRVGLRPARGGGLLLGVYDYAVIARGQSGRWRSL